MKAQRISARAGGDLALQSSGDFTIGNVEAVTASGLPVDGATFDAQRGITAGGTANLAAQGEIRDGTGKEADVTAQKAVFTVGVGAGIGDPLEISVSGNGKNVLWGNCVAGVPGGMAPAYAAIAGGNANPDAGSMPGSKFRWLTQNDRSESDDSTDDRASSQARCAAHAIFDDLPLAIQPHEVYAPFTFLSLDLGVLPSIGQGFIDYPLPVARRIEAEDDCRAQLN